MLHKKDLLPYIQQSYCPFSFTLSIQEKREREIEKEKKRKDSAKVKSSLFI